MDLRCSMSCLTSRMKSEWLLGLYIRSYKAFLQGLASSVLPKWQSPVRSSSPQNLLELWKRNIALNHDNNVLVIIGIPFILMQMHILHIEYFAGIRIHVKTWMIKLKYVENVHYVCYRRNVSCHHLFAVASIRNRATFHNIICGSLHPYDCARCPSCRYHNDERTCDLQCNSGPQIDPFKFVGSGVRPIGRFGKRHSARAIFAAAGLNPSLQDAGAAPRHASRTGRTSMKALFGEAQGFVWPWQRLLHLELINSECLYFLFWLQVPDSVFVSDDHLLRPWLTWNPSSTAICPSSKCILSYWWINRNVADYMCDLPGIFK